MIAGDDHMRDYMDMRVTPPKRGTSPTCNPRHIKLGHPVLYPYSDKKLFPFPSVLISFLLTCKLAKANIEGAENTPTVPTNVTSIAILVTLSWDTPCCTHIPTKSCAPFLPVLIFFASDMQQQQQQQQRLYFHNNINNNNNNSNINNNNNNLHTTMTQNQHRDNGDLFSDPDLHTTLSQEQKLHNGDQERCSFLEPANRILETIIHCRHYLSSH